MLGIDVKKERDQDGCSPKTLPSDGESHLPSGDNSGYFVRPVAVANIFKPALENAENTSRKPNLPEKRRFSLLAGDLQLCGGPTKPILSKDEFDKRRQSWDTKSTVNIPPFGQNLLKKTPKRNSVVEVQNSTSEKSGYEITTYSTKQLISRNGIPPAVNGDCSNNNGNLTPSKYSRNCEVPKKCEDNSSNAILSKTNFTNETNNSTVTSNIVNKQENNIIKTANLENGDCNNSLHAPQVLRRQRPKPSSAGKAAVEVNDLQNTIQINSTTSSLVNIKQQLLNSETSSALNANKNNSKIVNDSSASSPTISSTKREKYRIPADGVSSNKIEEINSAYVKKNLQNNAISDVQANKSSETSANSANETVKQHNKVYGLIKRNTSNNTGEINNSTTSLTSLKNIKNDSSISHLDNEINSASCERPSSKQEKTKIEKTEQVRKEDDNIPSKNFTDLPKKFSTARRTSDVIAAKIQSIFSNVSNEKVSNPVKPDVAIRKRVTKDSSIDVNNSSSALPLEHVDNTSNDKCHSDTAQVEVRQPLSTKAGVTKDKTSHQSQESLQPIKHTKFAKNTTPTEENKSEKLSTKGCGDKITLAEKQISNGEVYVNKTKVSTENLHKSEKVKEQEQGFMNDNCKKLNEKTCNRNEVTLKLSSQNSQFATNGKEVKPSVLNSVPSHPDKLLITKQLNNGSTIEPLKNNSEQNVITPVMINAKTISVKDSSLHFSTTQSSQLLEQTNKKSGNVTTSTDQTKQGDNILRLKKMSEFSLKSTPTDNSSSCSINVPETSPYCVNNHSVPKNIPVNSFPFAPVVGEKSNSGPTTPVPITSSSGAKDSGIKNTTSISENHQNINSVNGYCESVTMEKTPENTEIVKSANYTIQHGHNNVHPMHDVDNIKIMKKELSVRPKNSILDSPVNHSSSLNNTDSLKNQLKNLNSFTPPPPQSFDICTASLSNSFASLSSASSSMEHNHMNGSTSSMDSLTSDSKVPKPPERKRSSLLRETSLPLHSATNIARTSSLKRFSDSTMPIRTPSVVLRSPSHSTLPASYNPHRYSYTEMLSKVASFDIMPSKSNTSTFNPPYKKYNFGSLSSSLSQVSELRSDLSHEQSSAAHTSEILETETTERMRLEKEVSDIQSRFSHMQQKSDKMEMEMIEARVYRSSELNGDLSEDEDCEGSSSIYKQKYEKAVQDMEMMKRRIQQQREEEMEQNLLVKKAADKKLGEALEDVEEERQVANQWKRKAQKLGSELQDLRLMLEEQMARNGELEKKQRGFDAELMSCKEEIKKERTLKDKILRERDLSQREKYSIEQELHTTRLDMDIQHEKIIQLNRELDELTLSSKGEEEVTQLKRAKQEVERKCRDIEEELEEYVGQVQMLEQAKLRLEMSLEKLRQEHRRESSVREEEIEELRASFSKKIKNLEAQLETEQEDRHQLVKQKHELERRVIELTDQPPPHDPEIERRLRRDLKRTKALLRDAQAMLEHVRDGQGNKSVIRQLKNQLEDAEFTKCSAIKAKQAAEMELQDLQSQLEEVTKQKNDHESRCLQLAREKSALQTQLEEMEEETSEVMKKYNASVAQISSDQKTIAEQNQQIAELESEKNALKDQLSEVSTKFEHLAGQTEDTHRTFRLDAKVRDLESKLELEQTSRSRFEHQITRLKEQIDRLQEECDSLRNKELQAQESTRRFQRQIRDLREDYAALQQKESDAYRKQHDLELALENTEGELKITKNDLRLACQRIEELKNALEDDLDSGTDVPDDSGSDSDSSLDMSTMTRPCFTPIQRCESVSSNLSFGSRRSITPSYGDMSNLCKGIWSQMSMDFLT